MAITFVRGFRRIGWVATFPLAAFLILLFSEQTREVYQFDRKQVDREACPWEKPIEISMIHAKAYFPIETSEEDIGKAIAEIEKEWKEVQVPDSFIPCPYEVIPLRRMNRFKLLGLSLCSLFVAALVIQFSISVVVWVVRGFIRRDYKA